MGNLSNNAGDVNETGKKESVYISKTATLLHVHYTFFLFLSRRCKSAAWNVLISRSLLMELMNTAQEIFFFLNSDTVLSDLTPDNFAKILQIKLN